MNNAVFWDIETQFLLDRRHVTYPLHCPAGSCCVRFENFDGSDYEECRLLGYKNPVRTSQETHYVSVTECSQLMLCRI
jgi:hypothetical protein